MMTVGIPKEVSDCGYFEISDFNPEFTKSFQEMCERASRYIDFHREELLKAWFARTGVDPTEAVLVIYNDGMTCRATVERRNAKDKDVIASWRHGEGEMA